ncbi:alpha-L-rhamnosidase A [Thozetella sp. PMI_491]|nr:alpha-L-rhamnosidase A [Thozetella sp. PMI_491]
MTVTISEVTFEHYRDAFGIAESTPRISWKFTGEEQNWVQRLYELEISIAGEPEHRQLVESRDCLFVAWPARPLASGERATVRVKARGTDGHFTPWSKTYAVETGLLRIDDWNCSLIEAPQYTVVDAPKRPVLFRKVFSLPKPVRRARLYATAHGVYEASINGKKVGDHILAPGWCSYNNRLAYQTFDVTHHLMSGRNAIGAIVAEGWWAGRLGMAGGTRNVWGEHLGFIAQLVVTYEDGSTDAFGTDPEWTASTGGLVTSEIYDGEVYDARAEPVGWAAPDYDNRETWTPVVASSLAVIAPTLVPPAAPPMREIQEIRPIAAWKSPSGKSLVDFGQNLVGYLRVRVRGPSGHRITFQHVEVLEHGEAGTRPLTGAAARDTFTLRGLQEKEAWQPRFTYHGFRYVEISAWPSINGLPDLEDLIAVVVHTDMERTGYFECSDKLLNQLHKNVVWSMRGNFHSVPTDCPQRGERLGWTGDIQAFGPTAAYLYYSAGMLQDWLRDLAAEQHENGGAVPPMTVPDVLHKNPIQLFRTRSRQAQAIWGDVSVFLPWDLYLATGDCQILRRQYPSMLSWLDRGIPRKVNGLWDLSKNPQFGDWLDPSAPPDDPGNATTDDELVANAFLIGATDLMVKIGHVLGEADDVARYTAAAAALREEFQVEFITPSGRVGCDTQTAFTLALYFAVFSSDSQIKRAGERLVEIIRGRSRFKIGTGFAGTPLISHALTATGNTQIFYRMLQHRKNPSWLYPVMMGATTVWERWDSMLPDGSINPGTMTSFNHYALGSVAHWMHKVIGGLHAAEAGWRKVIISPIPGGTITSAETSFNGPCGVVRSAWKIEETEHGCQYVLDITVPPNSSAVVTLPDATTQELRYLKGAMAT